MPMRLILPFFLAQLAFGQGLLGNRVQIGTVGGVSLTESFRGFGINESKRYLIGPSVEVRIHGGFAVELDAIYRRLGSSGAFNSRVSPEGPTYLYSFKVRGNSWELPVLAKYNFERRIAGMRPFLATGYAFRTGWSKTENRTTNPIATTIIYDSDSRDRLSIGAVAAAGVNLQAGHLRISPQFRYTRWGDSAGNRRPNNQVDFMVGIHF